MLTTTTITTEGNPSEYEGLLIQYNISLLILPAISGSGTPRLNSGMSLACQVVTFGFVIIIGYPFRHTYHMLYLDFQKET